MLGGILTGFLDIIYPKSCPACRDKLVPEVSVDNLVCARCWSGIKRNLPPFCHCCGRQLKKERFSKNICIDCARKKVHFDRAFSPCSYEGTLKKLIHEFKYKGRDRLGRPLSRLMIEFIREYNLPIEYMDMILPVPLHKTRLREREFNQAEVLSDFISEEFNKPLNKGLLIRHRYTRTQTELDNHARLKNVEDCFSLRAQEELKSKNVLLVDDVLTTSATSSQAARTLKEAGANIVFVLTLAN